MRTTISHSRSARGRVLALRIPIDVALDRFLIEPSMEAESIFDAMAAVTVASADEPIGAVLIGSGADYCGDEGLRALRRIDPALPVVLFDHHGGRSEASQHVDAFDDVLLAPLTTAGMTRAFERNVAIRDEPLPLEPPTPRPISEDDAESSSVSPPQLRTSPLIPEDLLTPSADDFPEPESALSAVPEATGRKTPRVAAPTPADRPRPSSRLGDVDLVACIARGDGSIATTAINLIMQQTGWPAVAIHEDAPEQADALAPIEHDGQMLGWLHSESASPEQLRSWAKWLAQWLALERDHRRYRRLAYVDDLTGAWNRRYFIRHVNEVITEARARRIPVSIMVFDVDDFKHFNDTYGHDAGDEILIETVRLLHSVIRRSDKVCRIGGDEFVVVFADLEGPREDGSRHPAQVEAIARRFQEQICSMRFPKLGMDAPGRLTISAGLANFPWDGSDPEELLRLADHRALASKRAGKNAITFGPEAGD